MLYERKQNSELLFMKHKHDTDDDYIKYDENILDRTLSPYMYKNDMTYGYLKRLQPLVSLFLDQINVIKNFRNYMVDKYNYKHLG